MSLKSVVRLSIGLVIVAAALYFALWKPMTVEAQVAARGSITEEAFGTGSIESRRRVGVGFEVTARIAEILVDQGDSVDEGQVLARLDDNTFRADVASAELEVALVTSTLKRLEADIARAQAVLQGARDGLRRITPLVQDGTAFEDQLDVASERERVAVAELARAEAAMVEGQSATAVAGSKLHRAEVELERTILRSPFKGTVLLREREVGDVAVPGAPVLRLASSETVWASVWVDESHINSLRLGLPARIVLRSDSAQAYPGQVARIGREVDRETRELLVDVAFSAPSPELVFGQRVDLWIELSQAQDTLRIPTASIVRSDGQAGVFVEQAGRARFRPIELGIVGRGFVEVKGGLSAGDNVLDPQSGARSLREGARVQMAPAQGEEDAR